MAKISRERETKKLQKYIVKCFIMCYYKLVYTLFSCGSVFLNRIYLDNSSTTAPCKEATDAVLYSLTECWGNPSSLHEMGFLAEQEIKKSREATARLIGAEPEEIFFNSCGTEGDNTAIIGAAHALKKRGNRIVTTSIEHPAVLETVKRLAEEGFEIVYLKPDSSGHISDADIYEAVNEKTVLVSMMLVNNEIGSVLPVEVCKKAITAAGSPALLHTDAVQAFGKLPINVKKLGVDMLTLSGHKIHAPKGIGALYIRKGVHIKPFITGGGQESGMRSGTESVPLIAGLGAAIRALPDLNTQLKKQSELLNYTKDVLKQNGIGVINSPDDALPYILNISVEGYKSETLLHFLEADGIYVSSGSACSKGKGSYVLSEMGLPQKRADSSLRISFSRFNTKEDSDKLAESLKKAVNKLRRSDK